MSSIAEIVDGALNAAGIPIEGVSIGTPNDRATWVPAFTDTATTVNRSTAATVIATVAVDAAAQHVADQRGAQAQIDGLPIALKAIVLALIDQFNVIRAALPTPLPPITQVQAIAAIRAKAGTL